MYSSPLRGSGVLNNELYLGRYVWNRSQRDKDPDTGKRMNGGRIGMRGGKDGKLTSLFGGTLRCVRCKGPLIVVNAKLYGCATKKDQDTCTDVLTPRDETDSRLLEVIHKGLLSTEALALMLEEAHQREQHIHQRAKELDVEITRLTDALAKLKYSDAVGSCLKAVEAERAVLHAPVPKMPQNTNLKTAIANYKRMLETLETTLQSDIEASRQTLRETLGNPAIEEDADGLYVDEQYSPYACGIRGCR